MSGCLRLRPALVGKIRHRIRRTICLGLKIISPFQGLGFAPTGLGTYFAKHSQGDALGFRIAPRWGLGHCPTGELGKGAIGGAGLESNGERP